MTKKDLTADDKKNSDGSKLAISRETAEEIVSGVLAGKKSGRQDKYFLYRILGLSPVLSATLCNYNKDYGYKLDRKFREDQNLRTRLSKITGGISEQYQALSKLRLVDIAEIEGKALAEYKEDPKLAISKPQLIRQLKQSAGVLADDDKQEAVFIDVEYIRNKLYSVHENDTIDTDYVQVGLETSEEQ